MIMCLDEREEVTTILLDTGLTVPLISSTMTRDKQVPVAKRHTTSPIQYYARQKVLGAGHLFMAPLLLQYRHNFSRVLFEVAALGSDYDIILPRRWLAKHKCDLLARDRRIKFTCVDCQ